MTPSLPIHLKKKKAAYIVLFLLLVINIVPSFFLIQYMNKPMLPEPSIVYRYQNEFPALYPTHLQEHNHLLYASSSNGIFVMNLTNPAKPIHIGTIPTNYDAEIAVNQDCVYFTSIQDEFLIYNISNPSAPKLVFNETGSYKYALPLLIQGNYGYMVKSLQNGFDVLDLTNRTQPELVGQFKFPRFGTHTLNIVIQDNLAYLLDDTSVVVIVDIEDPTKPTFLKEFSTVTSELPVWSNVAIKDENLYLLEWQKGIYAIDVKDPMRPYYTSKKSNDDSHGYYFDQLVIYKDYAFVSAESDGIHVFDLSNPSKPAHLQDFMQESFVHNVLVYQDYLYVSTIHGLEVYNLQDFLPQVFPLIYYWQIMFFVLVIGVGICILFILAQNHKIKKLQLIDNQQNSVEKNPNAT